MPKGQCSPSEILKQGRAGYVLSRIAADHIGCNRDTIHTWATGGTDGAPIRVRSRKHMRYLFVHLDDCVACAAGRPVQIRKTKKGSK